MFLGLDFFNFFNREAKTVNPRSGPPVSQGDKGIARGALPDSEGK